MQMLGHQSYITAIAQQYYQETPNAIHKLGSATNYVFLLEFRKQSSKVIKIFKRNDNSAQREVCIYKLLKENHVPSPTIEHFDTSISAVPFSWLTMNALGKSLHDLYWSRFYRYLGRPILRKMFFKAGVEFAKIHTIQFEQQGRFTEAGIQAKRFREDLEERFVKCLKILVQNRQLQSIEVAKAEQLFSQFQDSDEKSLCHFDFSPKQVLINDLQVAGIIDWESAHVSCSVYDFARCELKLRLHYTLSDVFIKGYQQVRSLPDNYDEVKKPYQLVEVLAMLKSLPENSEQYTQYRKILATLLTLPNPKN